MLIKKNILHILKKRNQGMSLIEIMLVFTVIMAMLVGVFQLYKTIQASQKKSATKSLIAQVKNGIEQFKNDVGRYPSKLEELVTGPSDAQEKRRWSEEAIDKKNFIDGTIKDTYGNEIVYTFDKSKNTFDLYSWGPKGVGSESDQIFVE
jgi:type II secretion system protein G